MTSSWRSIMCLRILLFVCRPEESVTDGFLQLLRSTWWNELMRKHKDRSRERSQSQQLLERRHQNKKVLSSIFIYFLLSISLLFLFLCLPPFFYLTVCFSLSVPLHTCSGLINFVRVSSTLWVASPATTKWGLILSSIEAIVLAHVVISSGRRRRAPVASLWRSA